MDTRKFPEDEAMQTVSATECTGLMPALPQNQDQDAALAAMYGIHKAKKKKKE